MSAGLYIHIPFCLRKCPYCDFYSIPYAEENARRFVEALKKDCLVTSKTQPWTGTVFSTLYVGGGTPTVLSNSQLEEIFRQCLDSFTFQENTEVTVEVNPETIDGKNLGTLKNLGVNRLSLGVQSLDDDELKTLGRVHSVQTALNAYQAARNAGFDAIGIDLIFAIPGQSLKSWREILKRAVDLAPEHISTYSLTIEPGTPFARDLKKGKTALPPEDLEADMYAYAIDFLGENKYEHYEISNFAQTGFRSHHNQLYWDHSPYLGLGPSAHSFFGNHRSEKVRDVTQYIHRIEEGTSSVEKEESLSRETLVSEAIFLALRKREGLNCDLFRKRFGADVNDLYGDIIQKYTDMEMLEKSGAYLRLTRKGLMVANTICAEFM